MMSHVPSLIKQLRTKHENKRSLGVFRKYFLNKITNMYEKNKPIKVKEL